MADDFTIINGPHTTPPVGEIPLPDGTVIKLWSNRPEELLSSMLQAIGPLPEPPAFDPGGQMEVTGYSSAGPWGQSMPTYTYNPGQDVINAGLATEFTAKVTAYNARVAAIQAVVLEMFEARKKEK
jgi:hypothetical protein